MKRMSAEQAAEIIQHDDMVAFSGFTPAGSPKALPAAIARQASELHQVGQPFQIRLLTGASISAAADDALSEADAVSGARLIKPHLACVRKLIKARCGLSISISVKSHRWLITAFLARLMLLL